MSEEESKVVETHEQDGQKDLLEKLVQRTVTLTNSWTKDEFGSFGAWFEILNSVNSFADEMRGLTDVEKIELALDAVVEFARTYVVKYRDEMDEKARNVIDFIVSESGRDMLEGGNNFIKRIIREIDTNKDGRISKQECNNYCRKLFCCAPVTVEELEKDESKEVEKESE